MRTISNIGLVAMLASGAAFSSECVDLAWQQPEKYLAFDALMEELAPDSVFSMNFERFLDEEEAPETEKIFGDFEFPKSSSMTAVLTPGQNDSIKVKVVMGAANFDSNPVSEQAIQMQELMKSMAGTVQLRGEMDTQGKLISFYLPQRQKNLLNILFELPGRCVAVGDEWPLSLSLLEFDQNFVADDAKRRNTVRLAGIEERGGVKLAVLDYFVLEAVSGTFHAPMQNRSIPTSMSMAFTGRGYFNITDGQWQQLVGTLSMDATGVMTAKSAQLLALRPATDVPQAVLNAK